MARIVQTSLILFKLLYSAEAAACEIGQACEAAAAVSLLQAARSTQHHKSSMQPVSSLSTATYKVCQDTVPVVGSSRPMPARGYITLGTHSYNTPELLFQTLVSFFQRGGRLVDTSPDYDGINQHASENITGNAIRASGVPREEIWIQTTVDNVQYRASDGDAREWTLASVKQSMKRMNVSYLDSVVLHYGPRQAERYGGGFSPEDHTKMWLGLLDAKRAGLVLNIGVCLTTRAEIEHLIESTGEKPAILMTFYNPWVPQEQVDYVNWASKTMNMTVTAYSVMLWKDLNTTTMDVATQVGSKYNATYGQLGLQIVLDQGFVFLTPLYSPVYLNEDLPCHNFHTTQEDIAALIEVAPRVRCDQWPLVMNQITGFDCEH